MARETLTSTRKEPDCRKSSHRMGTVWSQTLKDLYPTVRAGCLLCAWSSWLAGEADHHIAVAGGTLTSWEGTSASGMSCGGHTSIRAAVGSRAMEMPRREESECTPTAACPEARAKSSICLDLSFPADKTKKKIILSYPPAALKGMTAQINHFELLDERCSINWGSHQHNYYGNCFNDNDDNGWKGEGGARNLLPWDNGTPLLH